MRSGRSESRCTDYSNISEEEACVCKGSPTGHQGSDLMRMKRQAQLRGAELGNPMGENAPSACSGLYADNDTDSEQPWRSSISEALDAASRLNPNMPNRDNRFVDQNDTEDTERSDQHYQSARLGGIWANPAANDTPVSHQQVPDYGSLGSNSHGASCLAEWRARSGSAAPEWPVASHNFNRDQQYQPPIDMNNPPIALESKPKFSALEAWRSRQRAPFNG